MIGKSYETSTDLRTYKQLFKALSMSLYYDQDRKRYHGISTALIGKKLAEICGLDSPARIFYSSLFHDLGGIGLDHHIVHYALEEGRSQEKLSSEELKQVRRHGPIGAERLKDYPGFQWAIVPLRDHHERYDGTGYPRGLEGEEIKLGARIIAVVDAWGAMTSDRPYRDALDEGEAIRELKDNSGTQFDPKVVEEFLRIVEG